MLTHAELKTAIRKAIDTVGLENFKRTSLFMSNNNAHARKENAEISKAA